jgi:hypothetical protein
MLGRLILVVVVVFGLVVVQQTLSIYSDFQGHLRFAVDIAEHGRFARPHILYPFSIIAVARILPVGYVAASVLVTVFSYALTAYVVYRCVRPYFGFVRRAPLNTALLTVALMVAMPLNLFTLTRGDPYFGYIVINAVHNPTTILVKPFSLLLFVFCMAAFEQRISFSGRFVMIGIGLTLLGIWAKPNYILCLLPALAIIMGYFFVRRQSVEWRVIVLGVFLPALLSLMLQYVWTFQTQSIGEGGNVVFAPFAGILPYEPSVSWLIIKLALSIAFPVVVYAAYFRQARTSLALNLSWLTFVFGAAQFYLLAETGVRALHGNWWWGAQIALWIVFIMSAGFLVGQAPSRKRLVCWIIFAAHVVCGIVYFIIGVVQPEWTT